MRLPAKWALAAALAAGTAGAAGGPTFHVIGANSGAWPTLLSSVGLQPGPLSSAGVVVARAGTAAAPEWTERVERGGFLILVGESSLAEMFGFQPRPERVEIGSLTDVHRPALKIIWERAVESPVFDVPQGATVFARERWSGAPVMAGFRSGNGAALWVAAPPGVNGYERFPYLLNALSDLGWEPPLVSARLWAFFDSSYRLRVDVDYFARRWRASGIVALHVAAWHFFESDPEGDAYLKKLIEACHREGILVYAWIELPHVSDRFWNEHPEWREKTAILQDAKLDWRKLMNLVNRDSFHAVAKGVEGLLGRFDWDGVNLAELYFESLEGMASPGRFTPMNDDVRAMFRQKHGFDPLELFRGKNDEASRQMFLDFRRDLAAEMEREWIGKIEDIRQHKPDLDLVLTHVDDRIDPGMRDAIGADAARVMPLVEQHSLTFLVEDPATVWNQSAQRYGEIARGYRALTKRQDRLAIDLNVVERYQDVYPTRQPTGVELLQTVHAAAANFSRVALYFESSLLPPDWKLLPAAAAVGNSARVGKRVEVDSEAGLGLRWKGPASVDGHAWPVYDDEAVWLPGGRHTVEAGRRRDGLHLLRFTGDLKSARAAGSAEIRFTYHSNGRALAVLNRAPQRLVVDGRAVEPKLAGPNTLMLPRGDHLVTIVGR